MLKPPQILVSKDRDISFVLNRERPLLASFLPTGNVMHGAVRGKRKIVGSDAEHCGWKYWHVRQEMPTGATVAAMFVGTPCHFLYWSWGPFHRREHRPDNVKWNPCWGEIVGPRGERTDIFLNHHAKLLSEYFQSSQSWFESFLLHVYS